MENPESEFTPSAHTVASSAFAGNTSTGAARVFSTAKKARSAAERPPSYGSFGVLPSEKYFNVG